MQRKSEQYERQAADVAQLREARAEDHKRLEDEQLEHAETYELLEQERRSATALRLRLTSEGRHDDAWREPEPHETDELPPASLTDLLARFEEHESLVWTGDDKEAAELDVHDTLGRWAGKTWEILCALQDYADERRAERALNVDHYLAHTPAHLHGYSARRHATDESETVKNSDKFSRARLLPVPKHVDERGRIFMGAHFKIAQYGLVSPRLHYVDNVHHDGKIYVGYIGPHLPNGHTN